MYIHICNTDIIFYYIQYIDKYIETQGLPSNLTTVSVLSMLSFVSSSFVTGHFPELSICFSMSLRTMQCCGQSLHPGSKPYVLTKGTDLFSEPSWCSLWGLKTHLATMNPNLCRKFTWLEWPKKWPFPVKFRKNLLCFSGTNLATYLR